MSRKIRSAVVAFALVNLVVSAAFALPRAGRPAPSRATGVSAAWEWLAGLFAPAGKPQGKGSGLRAGSSSDPFGGWSFSNTSAPPPSDAGSKMDPDGFK
jgi:hypothetical protein